MGETKITKLARILRKAKYRNRVVIEYVNVLPFINLLCGVRLQQAWRWRITENAQK